MGMSRFRRGHGFYDLHSEMNRLLDETYGGLSYQPGGQQRAQQLTEWAPAVDVLERDGDLVVRAELPGVRSQDVDITLQNRVLTISGERREEQEEQRGGYHVRERRHGSFSRSMTLPEGVDEDSIRARYENGVLEVTIAGAAAVRQPRRIQIEGATGPGADTGIVTEGPGAEGTRAEGRATPGGVTLEGAPRTEGPGPTAR